MKKKKILNMFHNTNRKMVILKAAGKKLNVCSVINRNEPKLGSNETNLFDTS